MSVLVSGLLIMFVLFMYLGLITVEDYKKKKFGKHVISLFQPGRIVNEVEISGHVKPIEQIKHVYTIIERKDYYVLVKDEKGFEQEFSIGGFFILSDRVDFYESDGTFIESVNSKKYLEEE